ncbi:MAG: hypothetical protein IJ323_04260 [Clostridia bacterium]|nr:hypothetical protein [Clostridia bacterium]
MMFDLRTFIKRGFLNAVGKMADYKIILNAAGWYEKGVLEESDLAEIQIKIDEKNTLDESLNEEDALEEEEA